MDRTGTFQDVPDSQFTIQPTPTLDHQIFTLIEKSTQPQRVLGVYTVPNNSTIHQQKILMQKSVVAICFSKRDLPIGLVVVVVVVVVGIDEMIRTWYIAVFTKSFLRNIRNTLRRILR